MPPVEPITSEALPAWLAFFTFQSVNVLYVLAGCMVLGFSAGLAGCFAFLRKQSLIGDALAHAALPGVCMAFLLTGTKDPLVILLGAVATCWLGALSVDAITRFTRCKEDSALGMVLSVYFGAGIMLLTRIQKTGEAAQSGLDKFLFGQAAAMVERDVVVIACVGGLIVAGVLLAYKELKVISFDPEFAASVGVPRRWIEAGLATVIVLAVAIGLQAVGVVLMAALLVTPPASARYWTDRLAVMLVLSALFGMASGFFGAYASYLSPQMPTGPWMVIAVTMLFGVSFLFAPQRGLVSRLLRVRRFRRRTQEENLLRTLYLLSERTQYWGQPFAPATILQHREMPLNRLYRTLQRLERLGWTRSSADGRFALTQAGVARAARVTRLHRLWELYLTRKLELAPDHVHDDAEEIEHIITPDLEARLAAVLDNPEEDPHRSRIPRATETAGEAAR